MDSAFFPLPEHAERQYVYLFTVGVSRHTSKNKQALGTRCRKFQSKHVCLFVFGVHNLLFFLFKIFLCLCCCMKLYRLQIVIGRDNIYSFAIKSLYLSSCSSFHAADLYLSGSGSCDLDKLHPEPGNASDTYFMPIVGSGTVASCTERSWPCVVLLFVSYNGGASANESEQ